jgi:hypothetical protein
MASLFRVKPADLFQYSSDIGRNHPGAQLAGFKLALFIESSYLGPFQIIQDRQVERARQPILREFPRASDVDDPILMKSMGHIGEVDLVLFERQHISDV